MTIELICSGLLHLALQKPPPGSVTEVLGRKTATPQTKKLLIRFLLCLSGYRHTDKHLRHVPANQVYCKEVPAPADSGSPANVQKETTSRPQPCVRGGEEGTQQQSYNSLILFLPTSLRLLHCQKQNQAQTQTTQRAVHGAAAFQKLNC